MVMVMVLVAKRHNGSIETNKTKVTTIGNKQLLMIRATVKIDCSRLEKIQKKKKSKTKRGNEQGLLMVIGEIKKTIKN